MRITMRLSAVRLVPPLGRVGRPELIIQGLAYSERLRCTGYGGGRGVGMVLDVASSQMRHVDTTKRKTGWTREIGPWRGKI